MRMWALLSTVGRTYNRDACVVPIFFVPRHRMAASAGGEWYPAQGTNDPCTFTIPYANPNWVPRHLVAHSGTQIEVVFVTPPQPAGDQFDATKPKSEIRTAQPHGFPPMAEFYFRLATAADNPAQAGSGYPPLWGESEGRTGAVGIPANSTDAHAVEPMDTDERLLQEAVSERECEGCGRKSSCGAYLCGCIVWFVVSCGVMVANAEISMAIGISHNWLAVLAWLLVGNPALLIISGFAMFFILACFEFERVQNIVMWAILLFIWALCFCTPYSMIWGQLTSATNYLAPGSAVSVNCYRDGGANISSGLQYNYITFEENTWRLEVMPYEQKMSVVADTDDDDVLQGYHEFCAAKITYTGSVPCRTDNLYAICYQHVGTATPLPPCDPVACGWVGPPNGVYVRPVESSEEFYRAVETVEEANSYAYLVKKGSTGALSKFNPVAVAFAADGPDALVAVVANNTQLVAIMRGLIYGIWFALSLLMAILHREEWHVEYVLKALACCCCVLACFCSD